MSHHRTPVIQSLRQLAAFVTTLLCIDAGCAQQVHIDRKVEISTGAGEQCYYEEVTVNGARKRDTTAICSTPGFSGVLPKSARIDVPIDVISIGVSQFDKPAGVVTTPAHTISAVLLSKTFAELRTNALTGDDRLRYSIESTSYTSKDSRIIEMARLALAPNDSSLPVEDTAKALTELRPLPITPAMVGHRPSEPWFYQQGLPVTKERFHSALLEQSARVRDRRTPFVMLYVASHGVSTADGESFFYLYDSVKGDSDSMVAFSKVIEHYSSLARQNPGTIFIVVFDTCQTVMGKEADSMGRAKLPAGPSNLLIVSAASPGEYAWHWRLARATRAMKFKEGQRPDQPSESSVPWYLSTAPASETRLSYLSQMSPLAASMAASFGACEEQVRGSKIAADRWLNHATRLAQSVIEAIPERKDHRQTIALSFDYNNASTRLTNLQFTC